MQTRTEIHVCHLYSNVQYVVFVSYWCAGKDCLRNASFDVGQVAERASGL